MCLASVGSTRACEQHAIGQAADRIGQALAYDIASTATQRLSLRLHICAVLDAAEFGYLELPRVTCHRMLYPNWLDIRLLLRNS